MLERKILTGIVKGGRKNPKKLGEEIIGEMEQQSRAGMKKEEGENLDKECGKKTEEVGKEQDKGKWQEGKKWDKRQGGRQ